MRPALLIFWMLSVFAIALGLALATLGIADAGETGTNLALAVTARFSFLLFWLAYAGGPLASLFGQAFLPLKQHGRECGLAFASAQQVHIGLVVWLCYLGAVPSTHTFVIFGIALFFLYLITFFSFSHTRRTLYPAAQRIIFSAGLNYIAFAFAFDFLRVSLQGGLRHILFYLPFSFLSVAGPLLRLAVFFRRPRQAAEGTETRPKTAPRQQRARSRQSVSILGGSQLRPDRAGQPVDEYPHTR